MFIHNDCTDPNLDWKIVNLSTFDSIVISRHNLFEVRASRIGGYDAGGYLTIARFETEQEASTFIDFIFGKLKAGHRTTTLETLVEQVEKALSP